MEKRKFKETLQKIGTLALCGLIVLPGITCPQENRPQECIKPITNHMIGLENNLYCNTILQQLHTGPSSLFDASGSQTSFALLSKNSLSTTSAAFASEAIVV